ncbi:hypothetical protein NPX13_g1340 [Xylaria arbuscula]|uniref:Methyltransferase domain-containing protein n=1 Tax=Xylaria arbuscula TaxID=114810 RepID=A0A9W8NM97_9PEZI|nr:hypothetical protein NPX13_g1340 [Xylaria arbuscula]
MAAESIPESMYMLNSGSSQAERDRLDVQHHLFNEIMQGHLLPPHIIAELNASPAPPKVLEMATGSAVWLTEVAKLLPSEAELVGLDYDTSRFPLSSSLPPNVKLCKGDMYEPFPNGLLGKFDVLVTTIEPPSLAWFNFQQASWRFAKKVQSDLNLPNAILHYIKEVGCVECDDKAYTGSSVLYTDKGKDWIAQTNANFKAFFEPTLRGIVSLGGVEGMATDADVDEVLALANEEFRDRKIHYLLLRAWGKKPRTPS